MVVVTSQPGVQIDSAMLAKRVHMLHHQPFGHTSSPSVDIASERASRGLLPTNTDEYVRHLKSGEAELPRAEELAALEAGLGILPGELLALEPPPSMRAKLLALHEERLFMLESMRFQPGGIAPLTE